MKLTIERTDRLVEFQGRRVRVWHGLTESGHPCEVFVASLLGPGEATAADEFAAGLAEVGVPHVPVCRREAARLAGEKVSN